jgi:exosortase/archaeosortase
MPAGFAGAVPPDMHWPLVYLFAALTFGIFGIIWIFKQMNFVKTIDPSNKSKTMILAGIGLYVGYIVLVIAGTASGEASLAAVGGLAALAAAVCMIMGVFGMRKSLVNYYNSVEPIQLRLSGVMTFFFHFLYFQYHFRRIADWKLGRELSQITGRLRP